MRKYKWAVYLCSLFLILSMPQASFSANFAITKDEWAALMKDESFRAAEQRLGEVYKEAMAALSEADKQTLRTEQRAWIVNRENEAFAKFRKGTSEYIEFLVNEATMRILQIERTYLGISVKADGYYEEAVADDYYEAIDDSQQQEAPKHSTLLSKELINEGINLGIQDLAKFLDKKQEADKYRKCKDIADKYAHELPKLITLLKNMTTEYEKSKQSVELAGDEIRKFNAYVQKHNTSNNVTNESMKYINNKRRELTEIMGTKQQEYDAAYEKRNNIGNRIHKIVYTNDIDECINSELRHIAELKEQERRKKQAYDQQIAAEREREWRRDRQEILPKQIEEFHKNHDRLSCDSFNILLSPPDRYGIRDIVLIQSTVPGYISKVFLDNTEFNEWVKDSWNLDCNVGELCVEKMSRPLRNTPDKVTIIQPKGNVCVYDMRF